MANAGSLMRDGEFWTVSGRDLQAVRDRRNAASHVKKAVSIAPSEYRLAMITIVDRSRSSGTTS
jgi:hypothetical protein